MAMLRLDGDNTEMEKPKGVRKAKGGKAFTGYQPGDPDPPALLHLL